MKIENCTKITLTQEDMKKMVKKQLEAGGYRVKSMLAGENDSIVVDAIVVKAASPKKKGQK